VSQAVLQRYQHHGKPAKSVAAEYDGMMSGGVHLYEHMGNAGQHRDCYLLEQLRLVVLHLSACCTLYSLEGHVDDSVSVQAVKREWMPSRPRIAQLQESTGLLLRGRPGEIRSLA
jgi:hypothetical protein